MSKVYEQIEQAVVAGVAMCVGSTVMMSDTPMVDMEKAVETGMDEITKLAGVDPGLKNGTVEDLRKLLRACCTWCLQKTEGA